MGFLDKLKGKKSKPAEEPKVEKPERPKHGTVSLLWGPADRRQADQDELQELQESMSVSADETIARYSKVLEPGESDPKVGDLDWKTALLLQIIEDNPIPVGRMLPEVEEELEISKKDWEQMVSTLTDKGLVRAGFLEDRINDAKYSVLLEKLKEHDIVISTSDKVERVREIIENAGPELLDEILSDVPERYAVTETGKSYLSENPVLSEFYYEDWYSLTFPQAFALRSSGEGELYDLCLVMYRNLVEAYWSKKDYKQYMEYSEKLAYLLMYRSPREAAYALAHQINANSLYKSGKILWETPLKNVYSNSELSVDDLIRYVTEEFPRGIYPKRTKVDKIPEVFRKYLQDTRKVQA